MLSGSKSHAGSIATRLVILLALPLIAIVYLGLGTIGREQADADAARTITADAELRRTVASVTSPAQLEQLALEGLARIDQLGIPRDAVTEITGIDLEQTYANNATNFDAVLQQLVDEHGQIALSNDEDLAARINYLRGTLETQRTLSSEFRASRDDIRSVFNLLDSTLSEALAAPRANGDGSIAIDTASEQARLDTLREVQVRGGARGRALLDDLTDLTTSGESTLLIVTASAQLEAALESYRAQLQPDQLVEFDQINEQLKPIPQVLIASAQEGVNNDFDPSYVEVATSTFLDHLAYLDTLEKYSDAQHIGVADLLSKQAQNAEDVVAQTTVIIVGLVALTMLLGTLISLSALRPIGRLRRRATQVGNGELDLRPLPIRGPSDIRMLTVSVNGMLSTLQGVERQIRSLSDGESLPDDADELPGDIGVSIRQSLEHLDEVTKQLKASEELSTAIVEQAADGIWTVDADGLITSANESSSNILGVARSAQIGQPISDFLSSLSGEVIIEDLDGSSHFLVASSPIEGGREPLTAVIAHDVSEHLRFEAQLAYQAHHDALTGLPNRFALLDHISRIGDDEPVAVLFLDLDGFKTVNDVQGHLAGDAVLEEIAKRLLDAIRPSDFVGRIGGDEFVVSMRDFEDVDDVVAFGRRLIREVELPYENGTKAFTISASIGVAMYADGLGAAGLQPLEAIQQADSAVYLAKRRGRGRVEIFDNDLQDAIIRDADLELALRSAASSGQLELHLQPIMDLETGGFTSAEALVRWNRPGFGLVPPGDFIPVAERSGLIYEIEQWVLREACVTLSRWRKLDPFCMTKIAVNVSGRHLLEGDLLIDLRGAFRATGADPNMLEIELTETQLLDDLERATMILDAVRSQGIAVAIDDFGTGYSSMSYLQQLPIDTLKIDREFVSKIGNGRQADTSVLDALLTIAEALEVSVVAEGIEDVGQLEHLREQGCDRGQGFLLARPVPIDQAEVMMGIGLATRPQFDMATMKMLSRTVSAL
ncbi:MAG: putative bifunctional diguanylate cyclase/phosphodiesterase [Ilumatobacter sp.]